MREHSQNQPLSHVISIADERIDPKLSILTYDFTLGNLILVIFTLEYIEYNYFT